MKIFLFHFFSILSALFFLHPAKAQDSTTISKRKLYLGIVAYPNICADDVTNRTRMGYAAGINIGYQLNESLAMESGLFYSDKGYSTEWIPYWIFETQGPPNTPPYNTISPDSPPEHFKINYHFRYIGIPVNFIYQDGEYRWKFIANFGGSFDYLIDTKQTIIQKFENGDKEKETVELSGDFNPINISLFAGIGVSYALTKFSSISVIPTINYSLQEITVSYYTTRLWGTGLNIKYSYAIK